MIRDTYIILLSLFSIVSIASDRKSLWGDGNEAEAVCVINEGSKNECFILAGSEKYDISQAENANLGKLGLRERSSYSKIISFPTK